MAKRSAIRQIGRKPGGKLARTESQTARLARPAPPNRLEARSDGPNPGPGAIGFPI
jgi:hypothetical protein